MRVVWAFAALSAAFLLISPAFAATVNATNGQVLLNNGEGYKQVAGSSQGNPGDSVVANPGGSGQIVYPDGCIVEVLPGTVVTIAAQSPCTATGLGVSGTTFAIGAAIVGGGVGAAILLNQKDKSASP